jgi:hypothetical protein
MPTPRRYRALQWFYDHEVLGNDAMLRRKAPTTWMRRLMLKEGEVEPYPIGQFGFQRWLLTPLGRQTLQTKPRSRKKAP